MSKPRPLQVLLAVSDRTASTTLRDHLRRLGCVCNIADTPERAEAILREHAPDLVLVEIGRNAIALDQLRQLVPESPVVALAAPHPDTYFQAAKLGVEAVLSLPLHALDYVPKLDGVRAELLSKIAATSEPIPHPESTIHPTHIPSLFATSEDMAEVRELIEKVAPTSATVLLRGESGVGKELAARLIHSRSLRSGRPFVKVNCAAIPNELLESELFGYEAGAFTGAVKAKPGKFELADGGTIFLDEIGELHPLLQAKLLHVLQDGEFTRLGAKRDTAVDVRIICATNRLLDVLVANGQFREDLFYRINVVTVSLPPLRSRAREIPVLVDFFLRRYASIYSKPLVPLDAAAMRALADYHWPGNIRELENLCKRYVIVGGIDQILKELEQRHDNRQPILLERPASALEFVPAGSSSSVPTLLEIGRRAAWAAERVAIERTLEETRWNRREAARRLGISYKALLNKIGQMKVEASTHQRVAQ
jgi:two-component system response regulator AtoC